MYTSAQDQYYDAHSTTELFAYLLLPNAAGLGSEPVSFGTLAMLSVSTHRDKFPVSACSRIGPRGFTAGHRTIAGTLAFNTIDRAAFSKLVERANNSWWTDGTHADELPPFDISIVFVNEFGLSSYSLLQGVTLLDCGISYSLENVTLMENYSYMAKNLVPLQPMSDIKNGLRYDSIARQLVYDVADSTLRTGFHKMQGAFVVVPPEL